MARTSDSFKVGFFFNEKGAHTTRPFDQTSLDRLAYLSAAAAAMVGGSRDKNRIRIKCALSLSQLNKLLWNKAND